MNRAVPLEPEPFQIAQRSFGELGPTAIAVEVVQTHAHEPAL
jgi:hypothetical protein